MRPVLSTRVEFMAPQDKRKMELLEELQQTVSKGMKGLEHLSYKKRSVTA